MITCPPGKSSLAFTLIELLIVVAIIAILAAIAVPNFLEAQVRSKVTRTKADQRTIGIALETYAIDHNKYPPEEFCDYLISRMYVLSTPIAYVSDIKIEDPFMPDGATYVGIGSGQTVAVGASYTYVTYYSGWQKGWYPTWSRNGALLHGYGPSRVRVDLEHYAGLKQFPDITYGWTSLHGAQVEKPQWINIVYDPTNGTKSFGAIGRSMGDLNCEVVIGG